MLSCVDDSAFVGDVVAKDFLHAYLMCAVANGDGVGLAKMFFHSQKITFGRTHQIAAQKGSNKGNAKMASDGCANGKIFGAQVLTMHGIVRAKGDEVTNGRTHLDVLTHIGDA